MAVPAHQLLNEVSKLTELQGVRVAMKESLKGAAIAGVSTLLGGMLFGPIGLAIGTRSHLSWWKWWKLNDTSFWNSTGGTVGGCSAAVMANEKFKSIPYVIQHDLTSRQKEHLVAAILEAVRAVNARDAIDFATNIARDPTVATTVAMAVISFLNSQPGMHIVD